MNDVDELVRKHNAVVDLLAQWERLSAQGGHPHVDVDKLRVGPAAPVVPLRSRTCNAAAPSGGLCVVPMKAGVHVDGLAAHYSGPGRVDGAKGFVRG